MNIESVLGGKVNILEGHSIGHFKQKHIYIYICTCALLRTVSEIELFQSVAMQTSAEPSSRDTFLKKKN
jgi:hypothetical protein